MRRKENKQTAYQTFNLGFYNKMYFKICSDIMVVLKNIYNHDCTEKVTLSYLPTPLLGQKVTLYEIIKYITDF